MTPTPIQNRPWGVTVLIGLVLMFTALQAIRAWAALAHWDFLASLPLRMPPAYLLASGLLWATAGAVCFYGLAWRKGWAPRCTRLSAAAYAVFFWTDRLLLQTRGPHSSNWAFEAAAGLLLLGSLFAVFALPQVQAYYGVDRHLE